MTIKVRDGPIQHKKGQAAVESNKKHANSLIDNLEELKAKRLSDAERERMAKAWGMWKNRQMGKACVISPVSILPISIRFDAVVVVAGGTNTENGTKRLRGNNISSREPSIA